MQVLAYQLTASMDDAAVCTALLKVLEGEDQRCRKGSAIHRRLALDSGDPALLAKLPHALEPALRFR
jgi:hypothetical protein